MSLLDRHIELLKLLQEKDIEIERLNNEIKTLLQENGNKEKVIIKQDNIIDKAIEYIERIQEEWTSKAVPERNLYMFETYLNGIDRLIDLKEILKRSDKDE